MSKLIRLDTDFSTTSFRPSNYGILKVNAWHTSILDETAMDDAWRIKIVVWYVIIVLMEKFIEIIGAKSHNLKNINCKIPRGKITVITGVSGSGKSTIAFDTLYSEGQRRYLELLSIYACQFLGIMYKPDVDSIKGSSLAISIEQKTTSKNPRTTVGTITNSLDFLRDFVYKMSQNITKSIAYGSQSW